MFGNHKKIISRRNRPAKPPLSLEVIVETALRLLTEKGPQALTLRKVAMELNTAAPSLYVYVDNVDALNALVLDKALEKVAIPAPSGDWRADVAEILLSYFTVLYQTPGLGTLALTTIAYGPNSLRFYERLLALLLEGGIGKKHAAWAVDMLPGHMAFIAAEQDSRKDRADPLAPMTDAVKRIQEHEFPTVFALREEIVDPDGPARLRFAMEVLISGVLAASERNKPF